MLFRTRSNTPFRMFRLRTVQGGFVLVDMRFNFEKCYKSAIFPVSNVPRAFAHWTVLAPFSVAQTMSSIGVKPAFVNFKSPRQLFLQPWEAHSQYSPIAAQSETALAPASSHA